MICRHLCPHAYIYSRRRFKKNQQIFDLVFYYPEFHTRDDLAQKITIGWSGLQTGQKFCTEKKNCLYHSKSECLWRQTEKNSSLFFVSSQEAGRRSATLEVGDWRKTQDFGGACPLWTGDTLMYWVLQHVSISLVSFSSIDWMKIHRNSPKSQWQEKWK